MKYDVIFSLTNSDIIFRVNDNIAANEDQAIEIAANKLREEFNININDYKHYTEIPYWEEE